MSHNDIDVEDYEERKAFLEDLKILNKVEKEELFRILKKNFVPLSENSNGIFFDVSSLDKETFLQLVSFMEFCKENRREFESREQEQIKAAKKAEVTHIGTTDNKQRLEAVTQRQEVAVVTQFIYTLNTRAKS